MNDMQKQMLKRVAEAADEHRRSCRQRATLIVNVIADALEEGVAREQIIDDLAAGLANGRPINPLRP